MTPAPACLLLQNPGLLQGPAEPRSPPSTLSGGPGHEGHFRGSETPSPFKFLTIISLPLLDHMDEVIGEDEWDSLTVDSKLGLEVPQKVAKVDVEELREEKGEG